MRAGDYAGARALFSRILLDNPGSPVYPQTLFYLAEAERALGEPAAAARHLGTYQELYPQAPLVEKAALRQCEISARSGDAALLGRLAESVARRFPGGNTAGAALRLEADSLLAAGRCEEALAVYPRARAALAGTPAEQGVLHGMGLASLGLRRPAEALELFTAASRGADPRIAEPALFNTAVLLAAAARQKGSAADAEAALERFLADFGASRNREPAARLLAGLYTREGNPAAALRWWGALAEGFPRSPVLAEYLYGKGLCELDLGLPAPALVDFQRVLKDFPGTDMAAESGYAVGLVYARRGEISRALPYFRAPAGGKGGPGLKARSAAAAAACLFSLGQLDKALAGFEALALEAPAAQKASLLLRAAKARYRMGRLADAALELRQAAGLAGAEGPAEALYWLGWCWFRMDRLGEARDAFLEAAAASPVGPRAAESLLRAGMASSGLGDDAMASELFGRASEASPGVDAWGVGEKSLYEKGWALQRLGRGAAADAAFNELAERYPQSKLAPESFYKRAAALLDGGRGGEALSLFARVYEGFPDSPLAEESRYWAGEAGLAAAEPAAAAAAFWGFLNKTPRGDLAPSALDGLGRALAAAADAGLARSYLHDADDAEALPPEMLSAVQLTCAQVLLASAPEEARRIAETALSAGLTEPLSGEAYLLRGRCLAAGGEWEPAREIFSALSASRADRAGARAAIEEGRALEALGSTLEAARLLLSAADRFPQFPDLAAEALYNSSRISRLRGDGFAAAAAERMLKRRFPGSPWTARAMAARHAL
jgi:TolA-binding protein